MNISVIGTGYVGLVTGACLAKIGHNVICVDNDDSKVEMLTRGEVPIFEPGLKKLIANVKAEGRISFSTSIKEAVENSEVIFICVGTPTTLEGEADLSAVEEVSRGIAKYLTEFRLIIEKSTVPVQTGEKIRRTIKLNNPGAVFEVASNPEFLREGSAIEDFLHSDRIVIGTDTKKARDIIARIFEKIDAPKIFTSIKSAEIIKHASNSFLAMKISYINALSFICESTGADINEVARGMGLDHRIGEEFLRAGIGFGGSCFPKDLEAFIKIAEKLGYNFQLLKEVKKINIEIKEYFIKIVEELLWNIKGKRIGVLGLSFKPNTDDMREAPSIYIINKLKEKGASIVAYDPVSIKNAEKVLKDITFVDSLYTAAREADALIILTEWEEFRKMDLNMIKKQLKTPIIIDGRNIFDPKDMKERGFIYRSIGRTLPSSSFK